MRSGYWARATGQWSWPLFALSSFSAGVSVILILCWRLLFWQYVCLVLLRSIWIYYCLLLLLLLLLHFLSVLKFWSLCGITIVYNAIQTAGLTQATSVFNWNSFVHNSLNFHQLLIAVSSIQWENELVCENGWLTKIEIHMCVCVCVCECVRVCLFVCCRRLKAYDNSTSTVSFT